MIFTDVYNFSDALVDMIKDRSGGSSACKQELIFQLGAVELSRYAAIGSSVRFGE